MLISKDTPISILGNVDGINIYITKEVSLDLNILKLLAEKHPNSKLVIFGYDDSTSSNVQSNITYNNDELKILADNVNQIRLHFAVDVCFNDGYTIEQAIYANKKINDWAEFINSATIDGKPLSPLEKYTLAYSLISNRVYHSEKENQSSLLSRNLISVMSNDFIVCAGFANILSTLCSQINVPCVYRNCTVQTGNNQWENHANCIVRIEDDKYNIHGFYNADPTWDAVTQQIKDYNYKYNLCFKHFLLSHKDYTRIFPHIKLDQMSISGDGKNFAPYEIKNITTLFPEYKPETNINTEVFDKEKNDINEVLLKQQILTRLEPIVSQSQAQETTLDKSAIENNCLAVVDYIKQMCISQPISKETEYIDYIDKTINTLTSSTTQKDLANTLLNIVKNLSKKELLEDYLYTLDTSAPENYYLLYKSRYNSARDKVSEITEDKMKALFENMSPILCEGADKETQFKVSRVLAKKYSPLKLKADFESQKTQD